MSFVLKEVYYAVFLPYMQKNRRNLNACLKDKLKCTGTILILIAFLQHIYNVRCNNICYRDNKTSNYNHIRLAVVLRSFSLSWSIRSLHHVIHIEFIFVIYLCNISLLQVKQWLIANPYSLNRTNEGNKNRYFMHHHIKCVNFWAQLFTQITSVFLLSPWLQKVLGDYMQNFTDCNCAFIDNA